MDQQTADRLGFTQAIGRYRNLIGYMAVVGLLAGSVFAALSPPAFTARAAVLFTAWSCPAGAICGGPAFSPVYGGAVLSQLFPGDVQVGQGAPGVVVVSATARTAAQAESTVDAAVSDYLGSGGSMSYTPASPPAIAHSRPDLGQQGSAQMLMPATTTSAGTTPQRLLGAALLGAVFAALLGVIAALAGGLTTIDPLAARRSLRAGAPGGRPLDRS